MKIEYIVHLQWARQEGRDNVQVGAEGNQPKLNMCKNVMRKLVTLPVN